MAGRQEACPLVRVEADQVDFGLDGVEEVHEAVRVRQGVVDVLQHDVLYEDRAVPSPGEDLLQGSKQLRQRPPARHCVARASADSSGRLACYQMIVGSGHDRLEY